MPVRRGKPGPPSLRKRLLLTVALSAIIALVTRAVIGDRGMFEIWRKKSSFRQLSAEVRTLRDENVALKQQIQALRSDPLAIERIAREELGYARPGEVTFVFRDDEKRPVTPRP